MINKAVFVALAISINKWFGLLVFVFFVFSIDKEIMLIKNRKYTEELELMSDPKKTPDSFEIYKNYAIELYGDIYRIKNLENHDEIGYNYNSVEQAKKVIDNI